ncbi:MAG: hypothetical protein QW303_02605 [Nitrososphaerota archaeon]
MRPRTLRLSSLDPENLRTFIKKLLFLEVRKGLYYCRPANIFTVSVTTQKGKVVYVHLGKISKEMFFWAESVNAKSKARSRLANICFVSKKLLSLPTNELLQEFCKFIYSTLHEHVKEKSLIIMRDKRMEYLEQALGIVR